MASREDLQTMLMNLPGKPKVYFDPPQSVQMKYPAIVYSRNGIDNLHADNLVYGQFNSYSLTVIDQHPDGELYRLISKLPRCKWNRHFKSENLNHDVFTLFY